MKNILQILKLARPLYKLGLAITVIIIITSLLQQSVPILSKYIIDEITLKVADQGGDYNKLILFITAAFVLNIIATILSSISNRLGDHFGGRIKEYLTNMFYAKILTLPQSYFDSKLSGKIVNQLNRGIITIQDFMNTATNFMLPMFLQSVFTIIILAYFSWPTALFTFLLFPVYVFITNLSTKKWGEKEVIKNEIDDNNRGRIQEVISNIKLVKSFGNEGGESNLVQGNLERSNKIYAEQSSTFHKYDFVRKSTLEIISMVINIIVYISTFNGTLQIGDMVLIIQLVIFAQRPLFAMSYILEQTQRTESGSKEFLEILNITDVEKLENPKDTERFVNPTIEFRNVSFQYDDTKNVLKDVSFKIDSNEKIALVGHSGAGKSTIINLILKFYNATKGEIFMNDKNYKELSPSQIRRNITLVFQENELFSSTVRENVAYANPQISDDKIWEALKLANAYDFVKKLPKGLDSEIGERGVKLSGGQKQRIQIARAVIKDSPILILDEATSSLDSKSESEVQEAMDNLMKDKLVIIIAHRFSTIQNVDKIMVLNNGEIEDMGSPKELSSKKGTYSELLRYQVEGNKKLLKNFELY